jgi:hypothetical protein
MNPLQKAAVRRKVYYLGAILGLFTLSMFWRGMIPVPLSNTARAGEPPTALHRAADRLADRSILSQATRLELRELEQGEPEIMGTAVRLSLLGSRGFAVAALWYAAIDKQKRNDFHEFEVLVKAVTTLQPHFITPWIFQSWNIAYNVSVEMHSIGDMYFYIARGIELLSEGERRNKRSPDMRYQIAFYYQNKFGVSDQVQTLRCLFQLSCIPPADRDPTPGNLTNADGSVNLAAFQQFCEKNPHLVRRLRGEERRDADKKGSGEALRTRTPADVVEFLRTNRKVPSRYRNATELAEADKQFPVLPPRFNEAPNEAHPGMVTDEAFSGFLAARAWFEYANALVPPNPRDEQNNPIPSATPRPGFGPGEYDPFKYRVPRLPMLIIFRQGPPRAQTYQAETLQKDGWFDGSGWDVDAGIDPSNAWFVDEQPGRERRVRQVVVGRGKEWSQAAWQDAFTLWDRHGRANGLILEENRRQQFREDAKLPPKAENDQTRLPPDLTPEQAADPDYVRWHRATTALFFYHQNRQVTNFAFYWSSARTEQQPETVQARKVLWQADQARRGGRPIEAKELYKDGLERWKQVLLKNPTFHRPDQFDRVEEETYEFELEYLRLITLTDQEVRKKAQEEYAKGVQTVGALVPFVAGAPAVIPEAARQDWNAMVAEKYFSPFAGLMPTDLPPGDKRAGTPWIRAEAKNAVLSRQGITPKAADAPPQPGPGTP